MKIFYSVLLLSIFSAVLLFAEEEVTFRPITYKNGLLASTEDANFSILFNGQLKFKYFYEFNNVEADESSFQIPLARMIFSGNAFKKEFKYLLRTEFGGGNFMLLDFFTEYDYREYLKLRVGQFKVPYNRQNLADDCELLFVKRSITNDEFNLGRDIGFTAYGYFLNKNFEYQIGTFNGNGMNEIKDSNKIPLLVSRFTYMPLGYFPYNEQLFTDDNFKLAVGVSGAYTELLETVDTTAASFDTFWIGSDIAIKTQNSMFQGEYLYRSRNPETAGEATTTAMAYYAQYGYFVLPKALEIGLRYGQYFEDIQVTDEYRSEITPILNYYYYKQNVKAQLEYSYQLDKQLNETDELRHLVSLQLQFSF